ncbi:STAS domain-containing protein [Kitasatospora sp. NPDC059571]|uniref:STAS domain-containing protein n=1 Tax=Kitasatospora sp. NPDC059571 TaxID=3346871 RepID=UPI0036C088F8
MAGELDQDTGPLLDAAVKDALDTHTVPGGLVLDISWLTFCDSGGLNTLIRAHLHARDAGTRLHLLNPTAPVTALLRRTGVTRLLRGGPDPTTIPVPSHNHPRCRGSPALLKPRRLRRSRAGGPSGRVPGAGCSVCCRGTSAPDHAQGAEAAGVRVLVWVSCRTLTGCSSTSPRWSSPSTTIRCR